MEGEHDGEEIKREFELEGRLIIGTIGHLTDHKGHRFLLEAMHPVIEKHPEVCLVIVGDGELRDDLMERARFLEIDRNVVFTGFREDVSSLIRAFDLYVQPSRLEGLCTTLFDVMLREVPVIATIAGGIPEALDHGKYGILVPPDNPEALAKAIIEAIEKPELRSKLTEGGAEWVRNRFSADSMVDNTLIVYRAVTE
jgi:glycosyltransferase involved in cell wall biosynthesis